MNYRKLTREWIWMSPIMCWLYTDDVNLIGDDIRTIGRNADVLLNACKDIGLALNTGKTKGKNTICGIGTHRGMMVNKPITVDSKSYEK